MEKRPQGLTRVELSTPQALFGQVLDTVAGQAFQAAGYTLQPNPMHQSRGLFRYRKPLLAVDSLNVYIEWQLLFYQGGPSRFRINLLRSTGPDARVGGDSGAAVETTLTKLVWEGFGVRQLSSPDHWWSFDSPNALGQAIAQAARLVFGFGIPWLEGTLPTTTDADGFTQ